MSKKRNIRVGLFVAATGALLALVLVVLAGMRFWESHDHYRIVFNGTVLGLQPGAQVFMNGTRVGTVDSIRLADDPRDVIVTISVRDGTPVHTNTEAMLQFAGITGLKVIDLRRGTNEAPRLADGGTIPRGLTLVDRMEARSDEIVDQTEKLVAHADQVLDNLSRASASLDKLIESNAAALKTSLVAIREAAGGARVMLANTDALVTDVRGVVKRNDAVLRTAMFDLQQATRAFKELAREVREKPSRLLFAKAPKERKLP